MPRVYLSTGWHQAQWRVTHEGEQFRVEADPVNAAGSALHLALGRDDVAALYAALGQALQDHDDSEADTVVLPARAVEERLDRLTAREAVKRGVPPVALQATAVVAPPRTEPRDCDGGLASSIASNDHEEPYRTGQDEPMPF